MILESLFTEKDIRQAAEKNISLEALEKQLKQLAAGFPPVNVRKPCIPGDGIVVLSEDEKLNYIDRFNQTDAEVTVFVPASGAASRMFKILNEHRNTPASEMPEGLKDFLRRLPETAIWSSLKQIASEKDMDAAAMLQEEAWNDILGLILDEDALNMDDYPKALIPFHQYGGEVRTAMEEHFHEAAQYAGQDGEVKFHFTIPDGKIDAFCSLATKLSQKYQRKFGLEFKIDFSIQDPATDHIAIDEDGKPFRKSDGTLLFRPAGHGALLSNLNQNRSDIIFVKNIDNIAREGDVQELSVSYKKILGGLLLRIRQQLWSYIERLETCEIGYEEMKEMNDFAAGILNIHIFPEFRKNLEKQCEYLMKKFDRPIRVCGMVKNEGEPGGGPFWVMSRDGTLSKQIVEKSQIDLDLEHNRELLSESTHFNPVDLALSIRRHDGKYYDLTKYRDENTGIITHKSANGRDIRVMELPGLWNGGMANWNTVFVEIPAETFNPVKTVMDLLRPAHSMRK